MHIKNLILGTFISTVLAVVLAVQAHAGSFNVGGSAGLAAPRSIEGGLYHDDTSGSLGVNVHAEYDFDFLGLGVGIAYNFFDNLKFKSNQVDETDTTYIHGPEVYARFAPRFGDFQPYLKGGVMYAMTNRSDIFIISNKKYTPVLGAGFDYWFDESFGVRAGYDRYFAIYDRPEAGLKFDLDYYHVGMNFRF